METFKLGDWVVTHPTPLQHDDDCPAGGYGYKPNKLLKIKNIDEYSNVIVYFFSNHKDGIYGGNFRMATEEEVRLAYPVTTTNYELWI